MCRGYCDLEGEREDPLSKQQTDKCSLSPCKEECMNKDHHFSNSQDDKKEGEEAYLELT